MAIDVTTLLEAHANFDRELRGGTSRPAIMNILYEVGLTLRLLETVPHPEVRRFVRPIPAADPLHLSAELRACRPKTRVT